MRRLLLVTAFLLSVGASGGDPPLQLAHIHAAQEVVESQYVKDAENAEPHKEEHLARRAITSRSFHDPTNQDLQHLQKYESAISGFPMDPLGFPDWMKALREGVIKPRSTLSGKEVPSDELDLDIIMRNTKQMPYVRFPHSSHTMWLTCSNCHPMPFEARSGATW